MALDKDRLKNAIVGRLETISDIDYTKEGAKAPSLDEIWSAITEEIVKEVVDNLEIKGVKVELPAGAHVTDVVVSGGGGLPAVGVVSKNVSAETHIQNNDGTGLVA